jgi:hypothetical protein
MSGIFEFARDGLRTESGALIAAIWVAAASGLGASDPIVQVTRADMLATARGMADFGWICKAANLKAPCIKQYRSRFTKDQKVVGVAYDWGGMDDTKVFETKLASSHAAGSHKEEGVSPCTAGVDCSGLLSLCWKQKTKFGTQTIGQIAPTLKVDVLSELRAGDALNKAGSHIVMFAGYNADGTIDVYEASGAESRVVLTRGASWARFKQYVPIRYKGTVD